MGLGLEMSDLWFAVVVEVGLGRSRDLGGLGGGGGIVCGEKRGLRMHGGNGDIEG